MHRARLGVGLASLFLFAALAGPAGAQTDEQRAAARSLATEGASAFKDGRFKDAADLFTKAESLMHAPPHLLYLARSYTKLGQLVKANESYLKILREQSAPNLPQAFRDARASAERESAQIEPKIGGLTITVEGADAAKDLQVKIDGAPIPAVLVGASQPIDPGEHHVEAAATGFHAEPRTVMIKESEKATVTISLQPDASAAALQPGQPMTPLAPGVTPMVDGSSGSTLPPPDGTSGRSNGARIGGYAALGIGVVGLGVGTVFLLQSASKRSKADDMCNIPPNNACPDTQRGAISQLDSDADHARTFGLIGVAVGGVAAVTGVVLLVMSGKHESTVGSLTPWIGYQSAGVAGRF